MRKHMFKIFTIFFLQFLSICFYNQSLSVNAISEKSEMLECVSANKLYKYEKNFPYGDGREYTIKFCYYPEYVKDVNEKGENIYSRQVVAVGTLLDMKNPVSQRKQIEHKVRVIFTYDKKSFVHIECYDDDIDCQKGEFDKDSEYKTAQTYEVLGNEAFCIVSEILTSYLPQEITNKIWQKECYHFDFICNLNGEVSVNY